MSDNKLIHCIVQLNTSGQTVKTIPFDDGREWTEDWSEACARSGQLSDQLPVRGGYEVVSVSIPQETQIA